jgi:hypothetical protein
MIEEFGERAEVIGFATIPAYSISHEIGWAIRQSFFGTFCLA